MKSAKLTIYRNLLQHLRVLRTAPGATVEEVRVILAEEARCARLIASLEREAA